MSESILYIARHGKTDANIPGLTRRPHSNVPINSKGREEAEKIGAYFKSKEITPIIYTATETRCKQTAKIIAQVTGASLFVDPGLDSWDFGSIELEKDLKPYQKNWDLIPPGGIPYKTFVITFRKTLANYWLRREPILLITHSTNIFYLDWIINDLPEIPVSGGVAPGELLELKTKLKD